MFAKKEFGKCDAQEKLAVLKGKYTLEEGAKIEEVQNTIEEVMFATKIYTDAPLYVLSKALYDDNGVFTSARFILRPSAKAELFVSDVKKTFVITACENFYDKLIQEVAVWFDTYNEYEKLNENVEELNKEVADICEEREIEMQVKFTLGDGIVDITPNSVVLGISDDVIRGIGELSLFNSIIEAKKENYRNAIAEAIELCSQPYDIVKVKNVFTRDLGIYTRRNIHKLIRDVVNRNLEHVRIGVGYYDKDGVFAVVEKVAIKEGTEVAENVIVVENTNMSTAEAKKGLTHIAVSYKVLPFNKETGEPVEIDLNTLV